MRNVSKSGFTLIEIVIIITLIFILNTMLPYHSYPVMEPLISIELSDDGGLSVGDDPIYVFCYEEELECFPYHNLFPKNKDEWMPVQQLRDEVVLILEGITEGTDELYIEDLTEIQSRLKGGCFTHFKVVVSRIY